MELLSLLLKGYINIFLSWRKRKHSGSIIMWFCVSLSLERFCLPATCPSICHSHNPSQLPVATPEDRSFYDLSHLTQPWKVNVRRHKVSQPTCTHKPFNQVSIIQYNYEKRPTGTAQVNIDQGVTKHVTHAPAQHSLDSGVLEAKGNSLDSGGKRKQHTISSVPKPFELQVIDQSNKSVKSGLYTHLLLFYNNNKSYLLICMPAKQRLHLHFCVPNI